MCYIKRLANQNTAPVVHPCLLGGQRNSLRTVNALREYEVTGTSRREKALSNRFHCATHTQHNANANHCYHNANSRCVLAPTMPPALSWTLHRTFVCPVREPLACRVEISWPHKNIELVIFC